jgi:predicted  nucleic acid-binding Zn-ribbon protein
MLKQLIAFLFGTTIASLQQDCSDALSQFVETRDKLKDANGKIVTLKSEKVKKVSKLEKEIATLGGMETANDKYIAKIDQFLN